MSEARSPAEPISAARRVVIKIGSAQLIHADGSGPNTGRFEALAADIADLRTQGRDVTLVSSGAVAIGRPRLGLKPADTLSLEQKQAAAAAGQARLIQLWDQALALHGLTAAQALLSPGDTEQRGRWLNARNTLSTLMALGAVPVINENDTVATQELRFGDNDRLAARVAQLIGADLLIILSDVDGLYDRDPAQPGARHIPVIETVTPDIAALAGPARAGAGTGGMATKIEAARIAAAAGCATLIAKGAPGRPIKALLAGGRATQVLASGTPERARRAWITGAEAAGALHLDAGAAAAVKSGKSLLPAGVTAVSGRFARGETVRLLGPDGEEIARGAAGYDDAEARTLIGLNTADIETALGYRRGAGLVHAGDIVMSETGRTP
ncbi:MAG: glutamate 5-kinase [Alphaproteobacteria bacterium]|nr:glutamate 5-kinase [Alphaproteobacteria bacterium]